MARDKRNRLRTINAAYALVSSASGDWLHLTSSVRSALDHYVAEWMKAGEPERESYDRAAPDTWSSVGLHMWKHDVELVRIEGGKIGFTLGRGTDIATGLAEVGATGLLLGDAAVRLLTDAEIAADPAPLHITNHEASTEYR